MTVHLIGFASGLAGVSTDNEAGPAVIQRATMHCPWDAMVYPPAHREVLRPEEVISQTCMTLARSVASCVRQKQLFCVIGGDHTAAIGTWNGARDALAARTDSGELGLIWIDAHMDSHTPETTESGRLHGMPLACLLGYGYPALTHILQETPTLKPANVFLIGVRSFERGEAELLKRLNVRVYFMKEVQSRGFSTVLQEVVTQLQHTAGYGLSIDLDGLDPMEIPAVDVPEPHGISVKAFYEGVSCLLKDPKWIGAEIVEFNPTRDHHRQTEKFILSLIKLFSSRDNATING